MTAVAQAPGGLRVEATAYDGPVAQAMIARVQQEYVVRYGGPDETPVDPSDFAPPRGLFLVVHDVDSVPVACGGWRSHGEAAEIKRMYVVPGARRRGLALTVLTALEGTARDSGHLRVELVTGTAQPEAMSMYERCGYRPVPGFGPYVDMADARFLGKELVRQDNSRD